MIRKKSDKKPKKQVEKVKISETEFEKKVIELAEKGFTSERIGETLKQQGIHSQEHAQKISKILKKNNLYVNPDLKNVETKLERVKTHYEKNKQDKRAKREVSRMSSQLRKIKIYLKE